MLMAPVILGAITLDTKKVSADSYTIDPRFVGNPDIDNVKTASLTYDFQHGGSSIYRDSEGHYQNGFWSGRTTLNAKFKFTSINSLQVIADGSTNAYDGQMSSRDTGAGFYDVNMVSPRGYVQNYTQYGVYQPESRSDYDYGDDLLKKVDGQNIFFGSIHYNSTTSLTYPNYRTRGGALKHDFIAHQDENGSFIPFDGINRYLNADLRSASWNRTALTPFTISNPNIKWINNTTGASQYAQFDRGINIAPSGNYDVNDNYDADRKMLSWRTGDGNNKYFTTGDKVILRNMSPIIQAGSKNFTSQKNGALYKFAQDQTFKTSTWVPDGFDYKSGDAKIFAITQDGRKVDVTDRFNIRFDDTAYNYSVNNSTKTNMRRLTATVKDINDESYAGYNNVMTVGYSMITPVTVTDSAHTDKPYAIRGGSQIYNGVWHDTGDDVINIWRPDTPEKSRTSSNAVVYKNDSDKDFKENLIYYDGTPKYANDRTFRTNEVDGYVLWQDMAMSNPVPDNVWQNRAEDSTIAPWRNTHDLNIYIPFDSRYVSVIGGHVTRFTGAKEGNAEFDVNTNGITYDIVNGNLCVIRIPPALLNVTRTNLTTWGGRLKFKIKDGMPSGGQPITSKPFAIDDVSGLQNTDTIRNTLMTPRINYSFDTVTNNIDWIKHRYPDFQNDQVHLVNNMYYGYGASYLDSGQAANSRGVGEPLRKFTLTGDLRSNKYGDGSKAYGEVQGLDSVRLYKGTTQVWRGDYHPDTHGDTLQAVSNATTDTLSVKDIQDGFVGKVFKNDDGSYHVEVKANDKLLNDEKLLYDQNDLHMEIIAYDKPASDNGNVTNTYFDRGQNLKADLQGSNNLQDDIKGMISQNSSRVKPATMLTKHDAWPSNAYDKADNINFGESSIQAREVVDYRVMQFLGNTSMNVEAYPTPMTLKADLDDKVTVADRNALKVKAYGTDGNIQDVTDKFDIRINGNKVEAEMKDSEKNSVSGEIGSVYNKVYMLSIPVKNQEDKAVLVKNTFSGSAVVNGQEVGAPIVTEFIPPETPMMYGYSATSSDNRFNPNDPEKDKGKISYFNSENANTSAQISTAPVQWVIKEQLGDLTTKLPQKYDYEKFNATFPDMPMFQSGSPVKWHVYNNSGQDVSDNFEGSSVGGTGYHIEAKKSFLSDKDNYSKAYYFVIDQSTENNKSNRAASAVKLGWRNSFQAFRNLRAPMSQFFGKVGIGNTEKSVQTQNFDMQTDMNLLQISWLPSNINEKTSELNVNPFSSNQYNVRNVDLSRPIDGYDITGATTQWSSNARAYESYTTSFSANNGVDRQQVRQGSVKITDSRTGNDVTDEYEVTTNDQQVIVKASQKALDRMHNYHRDDNNSYVQDTVKFHVDTWGSRARDTRVSWFVTHNINGYNDSMSTENVTIPQAHAGHKEIFVSPSGQNKWQQGDLKLSAVDAPVDLKIKVTVPNDLHNKDFTQFILPYVSSEITPFINDSSVTAKVSLGDNNNANSGEYMNLITQNPSAKSLNDSRQVWELPTSIQQSLNNTTALNKDTTYTVIVKNVQFTPTADRRVPSYMSYLQSDNTVKIPVGGVTTSINGNQDDYKNILFEGKDGDLVDGSIGSLGSGTSLGHHAGKINIILPATNSKQDSYVNGGQSNTSFTDNNVN